MKKIILITFCVISFIISFTGCKTGTFVSEYGKEDIAFITITSSSNYAGKIVTVIVDNDTSFDVKVREAKQSTEKHNGEVHGIKPGKRHIKVMFNGSPLYEKDIFLSSQQTKIINL